MFMTVLSHEVFISSVMQQQVTNTHPKSSAGLQPSRGESWGVGLQEILGALGFGPSQMEQTSKYQKKNQGPSPGAQNGGIGYTNTAGVAVV